jgi:hypothetical protein
LCIGSNGSEIFLSRRESRDLRNVLIIATILPAELNLRKNEMSGKKKESRNIILDEAINCHGSLEMIGFKFSSEEEQTVRRNF